MLQDKVMFVLLIQSLKISYVGKVCLVVIKQTKGLMKRAEQIIHTE